jgi:hypothetical protein
MEIVGKIIDRKQVIGWLLGFIIFIALAVFLSITAAAVFALFSLAVLLRIDCGIPMIAAVALLLISPILLALEQKFAAETLASWAYYFLAIAVLLQLIDIIKSNAANSDSTGDSD